MILAPVSFSVVIPPINIATVPIRARWLWSTPAQPLLDRDKCSAPLAALSYYFAPFCVPAGRDEINLNFSMMWANLLSATTSKSDLYMRSATPVGAPVAASNPHLVKRYVGKIWLILHQATPPHEGEKSGYLKKP